MGNCLVIQDRREIKVMSVVDGEILKAPPAPPLSKGALARVSGSSDADDALRPQKQSLDAQAGGMGQLHCMFPSDAKAPTAAAEADPGAVVRVKLVISKQELRRMLGKDDDAVSLDDMVAHMQRGSEDQKQEDVSCYRGWRPALHSIPCTGSSRSSFIEQQGKGMRYGWEGFTGRKQRQRMNRASSNRSNTQTRRSSLVHILRLRGTSGLVAFPQAAAPAWMHPQRAPTCTSVRGVQRVAWAWLNGNQSQIGARSTHTMIPPSLFSPHAPNRTPP